MLRATHRRALSSGATGRHRRLSHAGSGAGLGPPAARMAPQGVAGDSERRVEEVTARLASSERLTMTALGGRSRAAVNSYVAFVRHLRDVLNEKN